MNPLNFLKHHGNLIGALLAAIILFVAAYAFARYIATPLTLAQSLEKQPIGTPEDVKTDMYEAIIKELETKKEPMPAPSLIDPFRH